MTRTKRFHKPEQPPLFRRIDELADAHRRERYNVEFKKHLKAMLAQSARRVWPARVDA